MGCTSSKQTKDEDNAPYDKPEKTNSQTHVDNNVNEWQEHLTDGPSVHPNTSHTVHVQSQHAYYLGANTGNIKDNDSSYPTPVYVSANDVRKKKHETLKQEDMSKSGGYHNYDKIPNNITVGSQQHILPKNNITERRTAEYVHTYGKNPTPRNSDLLEILTQRKQRNRSSQYSSPPLLSDGKRITTVAHDSSPESYYQITDLDNDKFSLTYPLQGSTGLKRNYATVDVRHDNRGENRLSFSNRSDHKTGHRTDIDQYYESLKNVQQPTPQFNITDHSRQHGLSLQTTVPFVDEVKVQRQTQHNNWISPADSRARLNDMESIGRSNPPTPLVFNDQTSPKSTSNYSQMQSSVSYHQSNRPVKEVLETKMKETQNVYYNQSSNYNKGPENIQQIRDNHILERTEKAPLHEYQYTHYSSHTKGAENRNNEQKRSNLQNQGQSSQCHQYQHQYSPAINKQGLSPESQQNNTDRGGYHTGGQNVTNYNRNDRLHNSYNQGQSGDINYSDKYVHSPYNHLGAYDYPNEGSSEGQGENVYSNNNIVTIQNHGQKHRNNNRTVRTVIEETTTTNVISNQQRDTDNTNAKALSVIQSRESQLPETLRKKQQRIQFQLQPETMSMTSKFATTFEYVAALDLGCSYSGYAYASCGNPSQIETNKNWAANLGYMSLKTPSVFLVDSQRRFLSFGFQAIDQFGKLLDENENNIFHYKVYNNLKEKPKNKDARWKVKTSLWFLKTECLHDIESKFDIRGRNPRIKWSIPVPVEYMNEQDEKLIYNCLHQIGIETDSAVLYSDCDCALNYCLSLGHNLEAREGNQCIVISAGDSAVVSTLYQYLERTGWTAVYHTSARGGRDSANKFTHFLKARLGERFVTEIQRENPTAWYNFMGKFDHAKRVASLRTKSGGIQIPLENAFGHFYSEITGKSLKTVIHADPFISLSSGALSIPNSTLPFIFKEILDDIEKKLRDVLTKGIYAETVFLVGGFGTCRWVNEKITSVVEGRKLIIPENPNMCVVKGAVLKGMSETSV